MEGKIPRCGGHFSSYWVDFKDWRASPRYTKYTKQALRSLLVWNLQEIEYSGKGMGRMWMERYSAGRCMIFPHVPREAAQSHLSGHRLRSDQNPGQRACGMSLLNGGCRDPGTHQSLIWGSFPAISGIEMCYLQSAGSRKTFALCTCSSEVPAVATGLSY